MPLNPTLSYYSYVYDSDYYYATSEFGGPRERERVPYTLVSRDKQGGLLFWQSLESLEYLFVFKMQSSFIVHDDDVMEVLQVLQVLQML